MKIVIVGAGIGGLTTALSLAHFGIASTVLEAFAEPGEVGAGLQVPPNAMHVFERLGLAAEIRRAGMTPEAIDLADGRSGKRLLSLPLDNKDNPAHGLVTIHRAALHRALYEAAQANEGIEIMTGMPVISALPFDNSVQLVTDQQDEVVSGDLVVGADGVWSKVRRSISPDADAQLTGRIALRTTAVMDTIQPTVTAYLGTKAHLVSYPLNDNGLRNLVGIIHGNVKEQTWSKTPPAETVAALADQFRGVGSKAILDANWSCWPLARVSEASPWSNGTNIVVVGDAAHAIEPFAAQGAAMAIEDAFILAKQIFENSGDVPTAISNYEQVRKPRITKVARRTKFNRRIYHLSGLPRIARDTAFKVRPHMAFAKDLSWLYDYNPAL
ncbi:MAG: FAD-dependent monooxygenase [Pseudomonadota bacterium]